MPINGKRDMSQSALWNWSTSDLTSHESFERFHEVNNQVQCLWDLARLPQGRPFEASIEMAQVGEFTLSRARTDPLTGHRSQSHIDNDEQDFFSLMYMAEGALVFKQRDNETCARQGHIVLWDSGQPSIAQFGQPIHQLHLMVPRTSALALIPGIEKMCGLSIDGNSQPGRILRSHILELASSIAGVPAELRPLIMDATLQLIGATFHPDEASLNKAIRRPALLRIEKYILSNLGDPDLSVASIADALGYSPRHVHRIFDGFDFSVSDWIRRRRLLAARSTLASNSAANMSIGQIAYRFGFREQSHFSRAFKAEFGMTPNQFRQGTRIVK